MIIFKRQIKQNLRLNTFKIRKIKKNIRKIKKLYQQKKHGRLIFFTYELSHYQSLHLVYLAAILQAVGYDVYIAHCFDTKNICEIKSHANDSEYLCSNCKITFSKLLNELDLKSIILTNESNQTNMNFDRYNEDIIKTTVTRYYFGDEKEAKSDKELQSRIISNYTNVLNFAKYIEEFYQPDLVISNMTDYSYYYPIFKFFSESDKFLQISATSLDHKNIVMDKFKLFPAHKVFHEYIKSNPLLSVKQKNELEHFMELRLSGKHNVLKRYQYRNNDINEIKEAIGYKKNKRNIFIFPNLHWDAGVSTKNSLFEDVVDWVGKTFESIEYAENVALFIKPHPEEFFSKHKGKKGIMDVVLDRGFRKPDNVTVIDNELGIRPIDLFPLIDLGVVSSGTLGLEMLYSGVTNINVGVASYSGTKLDSNFTDFLQYEKILHGSSERDQHPRELVENFLYFYFLATQIPWPLGPKFNHDERFTISELNNNSIQGLDNIIDYIAARIQNVS